MKWKLGASLSALSLFSSSVAPAADFRSSGNFKCQASQEAGLLSPRADLPVRLLFERRPLLIQGLDWTPPRVTREVWSSDSLELIQVALIENTRSRSILRLGREDSAIADTQSNPVVSLV